MPQTAPPQSVALLVNPVAGAGKALSIGRRVAETLRARGIRVEELIGADPAAATQVTAAAVQGGVEALVACGGDGLVHLAIQILAGTPTALGVIPCGTGNDFARSVGLPRTSMDAAVAAVTAGHRRTVDLARAGDRWFGAVLASGFDSRVNDRGNRMRWPRGRSRYNLAMVAELAAFRPLDYRLRIDDTELRVPAMLVAVGNGRSYGGGMRICPQASMDDGLLDVTVVSAMSRTKLVRMFPSVYSGGHLRYPEVVTYRATEVELRADDVTAYADGECVGRLPITCTAMPGALDVLVPA